MTARDIKRGRWIVVRDPQRPKDERNVRAHWVREGTQRSICGMLNDLGRMSCALGVRVESYKDERDVKTVGTVTCGSCRHLRKQRRET